MRRKVGNRAMLPDAACRSRGFAREEGTSLACWCSRCDTAGLRNQPAANLEALGSDCRACSGDPQGVGDVISGA